ncbi:hypothetical protein [Actinopolyspora saharensis]|uniref:hypothetical protein n=1 Tax=Actinopolyspora saharensis TaxID=995062 RepID=UPI003F67F14E
MTGPNSGSTFGQLHWLTIVVLAVVGLVQPALGMLGVYTTLGRPWTPLVVAALIAVFWVATVVVRHVPHPLLTLVIIGGGYGVLAVVLNRVVWSLAGLGQVSMPAGNMVSIVLSNIIWGALLGLIAVGILRINRTRDRG